MKSKLMGVILLLVFSSSVSAGIYKYRDANGNWRFSDNSPVTAKKVIYQPSKSQKIKADIRKALAVTDKQQSPLQLAASAVVSVRSGVSSGSGFFINDRGYLLTNRHVVRPAENASWKNRKVVIAKAENKLQSVKKILDKRSAQLRGYSDNLRAMRKSVNKIYNQNVRLEEEKKYKRLMGELAVQQRAYKEELRKYKTAKELVSDKSSEMGSDSAMSVVSKTFDILLKNGDRHKARLLAISDKYDLALLKIDGARTPFISPGVAADSYQGLEVYAIGSPMGKRDNVTQAVLSQVEDDFLVTDSQVLPGNSGGPLLNRSGQVLGINTAKAAQNVYGDGRGLAIPIAHALQVFSNKLR